ncbi:MAG: signal peptide peptidase SppA [Bacteroidetes bacterium]|nr:signal peptide peptidase SppA [Bacteroidota bacterium]
MSQNRLSPLAIIGLIFGGGIFLLVVLVIFALANIDPTAIGEDEWTSDPSFGNKIGEVELTGDLLDSREAVEQINHFKDAPGIGAVLIRIDSPGGGVAVSQEIHDAVRSCMQNGKPVIASMGSVAASGGYYVAAACSLIVANPGTITGSIGVIMQYPQVKDLMDKVGVGMVTVKSGDFKDSGNPFRKSTDQDLDYFRSVIDDAYQQFVEAVSSGRKLPESEVRSVAEGKIYTGRQAYKLGLVDTLGSYDSAVRLAAGLAGIEGTPEVVRKRPRESFIDWLLGAEEPAARTLVNRLTADKPLIQYRMLP